ncbi:MAG: aspartate aminotransferase family protein [Hyphomicrobiaceae bacterium]
MQDLRNTQDIDQARADAEAHFWPHSQQAGNLSKETGVQLVTRGKGVWVEDADGERWFDTLSGLWLVNIGHGRREIADAVYKQMLTLGFSPNDTVSPVTAALSARLAQHSGDPRARVYYVSGGSEANETALKIAKNYHHLNGEPNRWKVLSRRGSYHGATLACTSLGRGGPGGGSVPAQFGPLVPGNVHVAQSAAYRCHLCADKGGCNLDCAADVERAIIHEGASTVAAIIAEPISAAAGIHVPDPNYWPRLREICDRHGVLLIADEVITGFCRTGKMFATEHWGVQPDIRTVAKGLTSGYMPIGAAIVSGKLADAFIGDGDRTFQHLITFGGNPVSCAAALANLDIMENENFAERSAEMGAYLYERLQSLRKHAIVGDVRGGKGLLCALELVKDRETKEQFPKEAKLDRLAVHAMRENRMLGRAGSIIPIAPPLCITREEVDDAVSRLDRVVETLGEKLSAAS